MEDLLRDVLWPQVKLGTFTEFHGYKSFKATSKSLLFKNYI